MKSSKFVAFPISLRYVYICMHACVQYHFLLKWCSGIGARLKHLLVSSMNCSTTSNVDLNRCIYVDMIGQLFGFRNNSYIYRA